jgi:hypothetical protein
MCYRLRLFYEGSRAKITLNPSQIKTKTKTRQDTPRFIKVKFQTLKTKKIILKEAREKG